MSALVPDTWSNRGRFFGQDLDMSSIDLRADDDQPPVHVITDVRPEPSALRDPGYLQLADAGPLLVAYRYALHASLLDDRLDKLAGNGEVIYTRTGRGGQVAQAALSMALRRGHDQVFARQGCLATVLTLGMSEIQVLLGSFGKAADPNSGGRQLPQLWNSAELGLYTTSPTPGAQLGHAAGLALASAMRDDGSVVVVFADDADLTDGSWSEALGFASQQNLPLVVIAEQRHVGHEPVFLRSSVRHFSIRSDQPATAFTSMGLAIEAAANGRGPTLITVSLQPSIAISELEAFGQDLITLGVTSPAHLLELEAEARRIVDAATETARRAPEPVASSAVARVASTTNTAAIAPRTADTSGDYTVNQAVTRTIAHEMRSNDDVVVVGNAWPIDTSLLDEFGPQRVVAVDAPPRLLLGIGVGMSMAGLRPIVQLRSANDALDGFSQLANEAAWMKFRTNGEFDAPIIVRAPWGAGLRNGPYHARGVEAFFAHVPGLSVVAPSTPADAAGLLRSALVTNGPTLVCEHRLTHDLVRGSMTVPATPVALGSADVVRNGDAASIITYGAYRHLATRAADLLQVQDGVSIEIIDLRSITPLDIDAVLATASKTGRVLILTEDVVSYGVGAELSALIAEEVFTDLKAPVRRLALPDVPTAAFAVQLDAELAISVADVVAATRSIIAE